MLNGARGTSDRLTFMREERPRCPRRCLCERRRRDASRCLACRGYVGRVGAREDVMRVIQSRSYYSITRCFYRHDEIGDAALRACEQQHVAWHNKRQRLPALPLNCNNAACAIVERPHFRSDCGSPSARISRGEKRRINNQYCRSRFVRAL